MLKVWRIWGLTSIVIIVALIGAGGVWLWQQNKDQVVAKVNDQNVYYSEWFDTLKSQYGREVLDQMVNQVVVEEAASKMGIHVSEEQIEQELEQMKQGYDSDEQFIEAMGNSLEQVKEDIRFHLMLEMIATNDLVIADQELQTYYEENIDFYTERAALHLHQIVVDTLDEANWIIQEIKSGSDFAVLAKEQSKDVVTAGNGGDLGWVTYEDPSVYAEVLEAADEMSIGEISKPIPIFAGYAVIKVEDKKERSVQPFRTVKEQIRRELALSQVEALPVVLAKLKREYSVKIHKMFQE